MSLYCLDTGVLIEPWNKYYSPEICPNYWDILDKLAKEERVFCTIEVKKELEKIDDGLYGWVKERPHLFREITDEVNQNMLKIMASHPELVKENKGRSMADPWVIAHAMAENAIVVTTEMPGSRKIKIPDVCAAYNVPWIQETDFAREINVHFSAQIEE